MHALLWPIDPRRTLLWRLLLASSLAFRVYAVIVLRNPMDAIFSDPSRHWDNAAHFLTPGPQGAGNPYLYQLYLWLVQQATHNGKFAIGLVTAGLSVTYPLSWYLFARSVFRRRINALRFATVLSSLPSHISMFGFFMNETLVLPLVGLALWLTKRTFDKGAPVSFIGTATVWSLAVLTRSVVAPIGLACVVGSWLKVKRRRWAALALSTALSGVGFGAAGAHAHQVLKRYTPFGDNAIAATYFVSGAHDYTIDFKGLGSYIFASPSLYVSPFYPFAEFHSIREGVVALAVDPDERGRDVHRTFREQFKKNRSKLPRLIYENLIFFSFGHCWPAAGANGDLADAICLKERWIWLPFTIVSLIGSVAHIARRRVVAFVPLVTLGFIFTFFVLAQVGSIMEGRYRMPVEPVVLLALIWLWEGRPRRSSDGGASATTVPSSP